MPWRAVVLAGMIVAFTAAGLLAAPRLRRAVAPAAGPWRHPAPWLLAVIALVYANQVLVTAYVFAAHGGDPAFIARYLPAGWFALADRDSPLGRLALAVPAPERLGWSVLRVPAFLELPLVLLAYLTVCRWFGPGPFARALRQVWLASAAWTAVFCLIELGLPNPFTADDVVVRVVAGLVVPLGLARLGGPRGAGPAGPVGLLAAVASAAALGGLVLVVYDTALLYNLGHLVPQLPWAAVAAAVLVAARLVARRAPVPAVPRPGVDLLGAAAGWFLAMFLVPALAVRYGIGFGARPVAGAAGLLVAGVAVARGRRDAPAPVRTGPLLAVLLAATAAGLLGFAVSGGYPEVRLLAAAGAFLGAAVGAGLLVGRTRVG